MRCEYCRRIKASEDDLRRTMAGEARLSALCYFPEECKIRFEEADCVLQSGDRTVLITHS